MKTFEPALYSLEENQFIQAHAGEPPTVAFHGGLPVGVNPKAVRPILERLYELEELQRHKGIEWVGVEAVKEACGLYLKAYDRWQEARKRGAPFPPTFFEWDGRGRPHRFGVGSDAGYVRTVFDEEGNRRKLAVQLELGESGAYVPEWLKTRVQAPIPQELTEDQEKGLLQCPICAHSINYEPGVQSKRSIARAQMAKHLTSTRKEAEAHRVLHAAVFGSPAPVSAN